VAFERGFSNHCALCGQLVVQGSPAAGFRVARAAANLLVYGERPRANLALFLRTMMDREVHA
jgi:hypothetical protein